MKNFKFTIVIALIFVFVFLHMYKDVTSPDKISISEVYSEGNFVYAKGTLPPLKNFSGYEYENVDGVCYIKIYSTFSAVGGERDFSVRTGLCDKIYLTDGKNKKEIYKDE